MELAIVTPNVHMTSNLSTERPTPRIGTTIRAITEAAVPNSMFGKQTIMPMRIPPILAKRQGITDAKERSVVTETIAKSESVTKMDVT